MKGYQIVGKIFIYDSKCKNSKFLRQTTDIGKKEEDKIGLEIEIKVTRRCVCRHEL